MQSPNPPLRELLKKGNPMDWGGLDRTLLLMVISCYVPVVYLLGLWYLEATEVSKFINLSLVAMGKKLVIFALALNIFFIFIGLWQRKYRRDWPFLSHGLAQCYTFGMLLVIWLTGTYTSNNSLLLVTGLALAFPLLDQKVIFYSLVSGVIYSIGAIALTFEGYIPYAPMFNSLPFEQGKISPAWAVIQLALIVICFVSVWIIMAALTKRWRDREQDLLMQMETQDKLASLGEFSARIIHQTRHQLGLMGISVHNLSEHLDRYLEQHAGEEELLDAELIRNEIRLLKDVQNKLRLTLKEDLNLEPSGELSDQRSYCELIEEEVENLQSLATKKEVVLRLEIDEKSSAKLYPQLPGEWAQGFFNVIENAIASAKEQVTVQSSVENNRLKIIVLDDGEGIPDLLMERVKQPFVTTKSDGSGMGLAIAEGATEKEGGMLTLKNRERGGLSVVFSMPLA